MTHLLGRLKSLDNPTVRRALRALAHPLTLVAVAVLLVNDQILRWMWPAWWTGKLGDVAWLAFFPLVLALPLALILPERWHGKQRIVIWLPVALTGVVFALMNSLPATHAAVLHLLQQMTDIPFIQWRDPTDLLTLPALAISVWIWHDAARPRQRNAARGGVVLMLGALATLATSPPEPTGIDCLYANEAGDIVASPTYYGEIYVSKDGGVTWRQNGIHEWSKEHECSNRSHPHDWTIIVPGDEQLRYRLERGEGVYISTDGGETWHLDVDLSLTEAKVVYYESVYNLFYFTPGPFDAIIDPESGNLVVAMGDEGIITRTSDGTWHWIEGVTYRERVDVITPERVWQLLDVEFALALALAFLTINVLSYVATGFKPGRILFTTLFWVSWLALIMFQPAITFTALRYGFVAIYAWPPIVLVIAIAGLLSLRQIAGVEIIIPGMIWRTAGLTSGLFALPYILWSQGVLPHYEYAQVFGLALAGASIFAGWRSYSKWREASQATPEEDA